MGKYDDMFNKYFSDDDFGGDPEKRSIALNAFNKMMESLKYVKITEEFIQKYLKNLDEGIDISKDSPYDLSKIFDGELGEGVYLPLMKDTEKIIREHGMKFNGVKIMITYDTNPHEYIVTEEWISPDEEYQINQSYVLDIDNFNNNSEEVKESIVREMMENGHISGIKNKFLNNLNIENQKKYYNILLEKSVEEEKYEKSALYRDKIKILETN